jgi:hypothetical protein
MSFLRKLLKIQESNESTLDLIKVYKPLFHNMLFEEQFVKNDPRSELTDIKRKMVKTFIISYIDCGKVQDLNYIMKKVLENIVHPSLVSKMTRPKEIVRSIQILNLLGFAASK